MVPGLHLEHKKEFHVRRWGILAVVAILLGVAMWYGFAWYTKGETPPILPLPASAKADTSLEETPITQSALESYTVSATHPRYIALPTMDVDKARVVSVGLTTLNTLDTPKNINDTAWYNKSATPGQGYGAVVIDGHNGGVTRDGIFAHLDTLAIGAPITIERGDGKKFTYKVVSNETMSLKEANTTGMKEMMESAENGKEGLSLITCAGNWVPRDKVFDKRIIVRAVIE